MRDYLARWQYLPVEQSQSTRQAQAQKQQSAETEDSVASPAQSLHSASLNESKYEEIRRSNSGWAGHAPRPRQRGNVPRNLSEDQGVPRLSTNDRGRSGGE